MSKHTIESSAFNKGKNNTNPEDTLGSSGCLSGRTVLNGAIYTSTTLFMLTGALACTVHRIYAEVSRPNYGSANLEAVGYLGLGGLGFFAMRLATEEWSKGRKGNAALLMGGGLIATALATRIVYARLDDYLIPGLASKAAGEALDRTPAPLLGCEAVKSSYPEIAQGPLCRDFPKLGPSEILPCIDKEQAELTEVVRKSHEDIVSGLPSAWRHIGTGIDKNVFTSSNCPGWVIKVPNTGEGSKALLRDQRNLESLQNLAQKHEFISIPKSYIYGNGSTVVQVQERFFLQPFRNAKCYPELIRKAHMLATKAGLCDILPWKAHNAGLRTCVERPTIGLIDFTCMNWEFRD